MATPQLKVPSKLSMNARKLWREVTTTYQLEPAETLILENACREQTLVDRLEREIQALPSLTVKGSMGQPVVSELVREVRQHRETFARQIKALALPVDEEAAANSRSVSARAAAMARWRRGA